MNLSTNIRNTLQLPISQLHRPKLNHTWIERQGLADLVLDSRVGVVAHDEVLALVVDGLVDAGALGEGEGAPILDAADGAAVLENDGAGCASEPKRRWISMLVQRFFWSLIQRLDGYGRMLGKVDCERTP